MTDQLQPRPTVRSIAHVSRGRSKATADGRAGTPTAPPDGQAALRYEVENLRQALETRDLIWEAKLIVAVTMQCGADEAHELLVRQSQHENRKLRDIAEGIVKIDRRRRAANDVSVSTPSAAEPRRQSA